MMLPKKFFGIRAILNFDGDAYTCSRDLTFMKALGVNPSESEGNQQRDRTQPLLTPAFFLRTCFFRLNS